VNVCTSGVTNASVYLWYGQDPQPKKQPGDVTVALEVVESGLDFVADGPRAHPRERSTLGSWSTPRTLAAVALTGPRIIDLRVCGLLDGFFGTLGSDPERGVEAHAVSVVVPIKSATLKEFIARAYPNDGGRVWASSTARALA
jgi:hypothetical protein